MFSFKNSLGFWRKQESRSKDKEKKKEKEKEREREASSQSQASAFAPQPAISEPLRPFRTIPTPTKEEPAPVPEPVIAMQPAVTVPPVPSQPQPSRGRGRGRGHGPSGAPAGRGNVQSTPESVSAPRGGAPPRARGAAPGGRGGRPLPSVPPGAPFRGRAQKPTRGAPMAGRGAPQRKLPVPPGGRGNPPTAIAPGNQEYLARLAPKDGAPSHASATAEHSSPASHEAASNISLNKVEVAVPPRTNGRTDHLPPQSGSLPFGSSQTAQSSYGDGINEGAMYDGYSEPEQPEAPVSVVRDLPQVAAPGTQMPKKTPPAPPVRSQPHAPQSVEPVTPQPPPRSPRRSVSPSGSPPPLPWREEEKAEPTPEVVSPPQTAPVTATPTPVLPTASPVVEQEEQDHSPPGSASGSKKSKKKKKERPKKAKKTKGSRRLSSMFRRSIHEKSDSKPAEDVLIPTSDVDVGDLPVYGLNIDHIRLSSDEQVRYLSSQVNELSGIIKSLLSQRQRDGAVPEETARIDKLLSHYNDQFEIVSAELQNVSRKMNAEYQPLENSPARDVPGASDSPHLARKHTYTQLTGYRQEQVQAVTSFQTEHKLKLSYLYGDVITVVEKFPTGWWKGDMDGKIAYFQEKNTIPMDGDGNRSGSGESVIPPGGSLRPSVPLAQETTPVDTVQEAGVLSVGELSHEEQWDAIENSTDAGYADYPQTLEQEPVQEPVHEPVQEQEPQPTQANQQEALALYGFAKSNDTEVGMSKGEVVIVVQVMDSWTYVHSSHGSGYVPTSYIKML